jgi:Matrixin
VIRKAVIAGLATCLAAALFGGAPSGAVTPTTPDMPALTGDEILAIAKVDAPPLGTGLRIHADFPVEDPLVVDGTDVYSITVDFTPTGDVITRNAVTSAHVSDQDEIDGCTDPAFSPTGVFWHAEDIPVEWKFNMTSTPDGVNAFRTRHSMRLAHKVWPRQVTNCDNTPAENAFHFQYDGESGRHIKSDGVNVLDFGRLDGSLAVAYTWYKGTRILEVDLRINKFEYRWTNEKDVKSRYQLLNIVTHELGHHIGLEDLSDPHGALTMYGITGRGEMTKATLGRGDMRGAETVSP